MRCFVHQWTARAGHEPHLAHALIAAHEAFVSRSSVLLEGRVCREPGAGREFLGLTVLDGRTAEDGPSRADLLTSLDRVAAEHADRPAVPLRLDPLFDLTAVGQTTPHALAAMLVAAPGQTTALTGLLVGLACDVQHRLAPGRFLVGRAADTPSRFFVLLCSRAPIDVDWYARTSPGREHVGALRPLLSAPPRWYALDPVWQHVRRGESARCAQPRAPRDLLDRAS
jgi:hypothetical protein